MIDAYLLDLLLHGRLIRLLQETYAFRHAVLEVARDAARSCLRALGLKGEPARPFSRAGLGNRTVGLAREGSRVRRRSIDLFTRGTIPQWLRMEDRMSMAWSVESRLPFMDYRLVELALRVPDDSKLRDGYGKHVLRVAMADLLPEEIAWRRSKTRFSVPIASWLRGEWRAFIEATLLSGDTRIGDLCDRAALKRAVRAWLVGDDTSLAPAQVWRFLNAELWLRGLARESPFLADRRRGAVGSPA